MNRPKCSRLKVEIFPGIKEDLGTLLTNSNLLWARQQAHLFKKHRIGQSPEPSKHVYQPWVRKEYVHTGLSVKELGIKEYRKQWAKLNHDRYLACRRNWRLKQKLKKQH